MALLSQDTETVGDESLENWTHLDSGGFGSVYKARHRKWGFDVAIKILRDGVCPFTSKEKALSEEAGHMVNSSCEFVLRVYGIYKGCPSMEPRSMQQGIVMEFMERGSVQSLLKNLSGPPPWPLAFRLAHQVALGMNFLHSRNLMHHDLKPSNVLLDKDLNAKLADFGLSRVSTSALSSKRPTEQKSGGSYKYMPPEAFETSYQAHRAFDSYSYSILLWSIMTGEEPYPDACYNRVALRIPEGDRPSCEKIKQIKVEGVKDLLELMERCWQKDPTKRPTSSDCLKVTEVLYSKNKKRIHDAVYDVLKKLESSTSNPYSEIRVESNLPPQIPAQPKSKDTVDFQRITKTEMASAQLHSSGHGTHSEEESVSVSTKRMSDADKAKFVDDNRATLIQRVAEVMAIAEELGNMVHSEAYSVIEAKDTSQNKMRVLYQRTLRSGGEMVKAAFYDALEKHESDLVESLGGKF